MNAQTQSGVSAAPSSGYDDALRNIADDQLGRQKFADQIYTYLTKLPDHYSVRVGLIASWGEGKTTICNWVANRAVGEGHVPVWFSPWASKTDDDVWAAFYMALKEHLIDSVPPPPIEDNAEATGEEGLFLKGKELLVWGKEYARDKTHRWSKTLDNLGEAHGLARSANRLLKQAAAITPEDVKKIAARLNGKRAIVILDDLDRVSPDLIPRLLMSVREIMNLENFSFLLPFDDYIVSSALAEYNRAEGFGENFLDKILDYRMRLPEVSKEQALRFFLYEMERQCAFVKTRDYGAATDLLPHNPRKLKGLVRRFQIFEEEGARHRTDEIDWGVVLYTEMVRQEDETFFRFYVNETFFPSGKRTMDKPAQTPWFTAELMERKEAANKAEVVRIGALIDKAGIKTQDRRERLVALCEAWRDAYGYMGLNKVTYVLNLLHQPDVLTWAEFDEVRNIWMKSGNINDVGNWVETHAGKLNKRSAQIVVEVLKTSIQQYGAELENCSNGWFESELWDITKRATGILDFIEAVLFQPIRGVNPVEIFKTEPFLALLQTSAEWVHFQGNESDQTLRKSEEALLARWAIQAEKLGQGNEFHQVLGGSRRGLRWDDERPVRGLYDRLLQYVNSSVNSEALAALSEANGISSILARGRNEGIKAIILDSNSDIWKPVGSSPAENILSNANKSPDVQKNARFLLDLLSYGADGNAHEISSANVRKFYLQHKLIVSIWNAAIAQKLQHRRLNETRQMREALISQGVPANLLIVPEWLLAGKKNDEHFTPVEAAKVAVDSKPTNAEQASG